MASPGGTGRYGERVGRLGWRCGGEKRVGIVEFSCNQLVEKVLYNRLQS